MSTPEISSPVSGRNTVSARVPETAPARLLALKIWPPRCVSNNTLTSNPPRRSDDDRPPVHDGRLWPRTRRPDALSARGAPFRSKSFPPASRRKRRPINAPSGLPVFAMTVTPPEAGPSAIEPAPPDSASTVFSLRPAFAPTLHSKPLARSGVSHTLPSIPLFDREPVFANVVLPHRRFSLFSL